MAVSIGKVTRCSASSGEKPAASLLICTWTLVMSGVASIGRRWNDQTPIAQSSATTLSTAQRKRIALATRRSRSAGRAGLTISVVMAGPRLLDVGADQEGAIGHIFGAGFKAAQHFGPFRRSAPDLQHPHFIAKIGRAHV